MTDQPIEHGITLPDRPWAKRSRWRDERPGLVRAGEYGSVAAAMIALFFFGRDFGADGSIHFTWLAIGMIGGGGAFTLPSTLERFVRPDPAFIRTRKRPYSEDALLRSWPSRRAEPTTPDEARIDMSESEG